MLSRPELRLVLEGRIEQHLAAATRLIAALDRIDPDPDLEPDNDAEDGADLEDDRADWEPSLGWSPCNVHLGMVDLELDDSDVEGDGRGLRVV